MGPLGLELEDLLTISCSFRCALGSFWLIITLGFSTFGFDTLEATTALPFWTLDFRISDSNSIRLWETGYDLFRILIFEVLDSEFTTTLGLEFFDFEII